MKTMTKVAMAMAFAVVMSNSLFASTLKGATDNGAADTEYVVNMRETVKSNSTDVYNVTLRKGETFYIYVSGDGDTDLDLFVYDENGNLIDSDTDDDDECLCTVCPKWTGKFKIRIRNHGNVYNRYRFFIM